MTTANPPITLPSLRPSLARSFVRFWFWPLCVAGVLAAMIWADRAGQQDPTAAVGVRFVRIDPAARSRLLHYATVRPEASSGGEGQGG